MLHHDVAFIRIKYSKITQQSMIQLQLEILTQILLNAPVLMLRKYIQH